MVERLLLAGNFSASAAGRRPAYDCLR